MTTTTLQPTRARTNARGFAVGLLAILALAAFLRVHNIARDSLWGDESLSVTIARMPLADLIEHVRWWEQIPPLHHLLLKLWMPIFGDSETSVRMPSALAGVASVAMLGLLVARLMGRRTALAAALLLAVNPMHIAYSQECRAYALSVLLGLLSCDLFILLLRRPTRQLHILYIAASALLLYTHIFGIFTIAAQHLVYLWRWWRAHQRGSGLALSAGSWLLDNLATAALFAPWAPTVLMWSRMVSVSFWVKSATLDDISKTYWMFSGSVPVLLAMVALAVIGLAQWRRRPGRILLFALLMLVPVVLPDVIAVLTRPSYAPRYAIMATAGFSAVAAAGVAALRPVALRIAILTALAIVSPLGHAADIPRADWRSVGQYLTKNMRAGDLAVVHLKAGTRQYDYYIRRPDVPRRGVDGTSIPVTLPLDPPGRHVWLIIFEPWYPANVFLTRAPWRVERRFLNPSVLVMELTDEPGPGAG